jgi:hypothetical protein
MRKPERDRRGPAHPDQGGRKFSDAHGIAWLVREIRSLERPPALYFECDTAFRRVTRYPTDWRDLSTGELEALSHST